MRMPDQTNHDRSSQSPEAALLEMLRGYQLTQLVYVATRLGIPISWPTVPRIATNSPSHVEPIRMPPTASCAHSSDSPDSECLSRSSRVASRCPPSLHPSARDCPARSTAQQFWRGNSATVRGGNCSTASEPARLLSSASTHAVLWLRASP
jgi:hypothetical protein